MFSLKHLVFLGLCAMATAIDYKYELSLYDYTPKLKANNTIFYSHFDEFYTSNSFYKFTDFPAGFNHYFEYPTLVVYIPEGLKELHGYYFPDGVRTLFTYGRDTTFFEKYAPIRDYFLKEKLIAFTPVAAYSKYPVFFEYYLKKFIYGKDIPKDFAVIFVTTPVELSSDFIEVQKFGYDDKIFEKITL